MPNNPNAVANLIPFKPGQSGNPKGLKPGTKHLTTWMQEMLEDENFEANILDPKIGLQAYKGAPIKAVIQVTLVKALAGDAKMMDLLYKYGWAAKSEVDLTSNGESIQVYTPSKLPDDYNKA
jgi:uncharacterized protein DUF5681